MEKRGGGDQPGDPGSPPVHRPPSQPHPAPKPSAPAPTPAPASPPPSGAIKGQPAVPRPEVNPKTAQAVRALVGWYRLQGTGKTFEQFLNDKTAAFLKAHPMTPGSGDSIKSEGSGPNGYLLTFTTGP